MHDASPQLRATPTPAGALSPQERRHREELEAVLDRLDAQAELSPDSFHRKAVRTQFRRQHVRAQLNHPGGTTSACDVLTRDLSSGGLAFVHNGYVHVGTRVEVALARVDNQAGTVAGAVVRCGHIAKTWHSVGVKFDAQIDTGQYVTGDPAAAPPDAHHARDAAGPKPGPLAGRLLHVDDDEMERRLLAHHLRHTALEVVGVARPEEAAERVAGSRFDLAVTEMRFPPRLAAADAESPPAVVHRGVPKSPVDQLRAAGFAGPIAVCTADTSEELMRSVASRNVRGVLRKPYTAARLAEKVAEWLAPAAGGEAGPLVSALGDDPALRPRLDAYVANLKKLQVVLAAATREGQLDCCRAVCLALRGSAAAHGFAAISEVAGETLSRLSSPAADVADVGPLLEKLADLCGRACAGRRAAA